MENTTKIKQDDSNEVAISLKNVNKIYPNGYQAVFDFNIDIKKGEFIVLVGPSGCGKSTTLRMVAGLEKITDGDFNIYGVRMNEAAPSDRNIAMVFQNYALYPHMSVYENMGFSLRIRKDKKAKRSEVIKIMENPEVVELQECLNKNGYNLVVKKGNTLITEEKAMEIPLVLELKNKLKNLGIKLKPIKNKNLEIHEKVMDVAEVVELKNRLNAKPQNLSGGQRQRVALGRTIARDPVVYLMDEPLSNLDAKLRSRSRREIKELHNTLGVTTLYVTHDQIEALTMADRIVIMDNGYVQQIGTPMEVYNEPENIFVGSFIGTPPMNFVRGRVEQGRFVSELFSFNLSEEDVEKLEKYDGREVICGVRAEDITADKIFLDKYSQAKFNMRVSHVEMLGSEYIVYIDYNNEKLIAKINSRNEVVVGQNIDLVPKLSKIHFFDVKTTNRIK